MNRKYVFFFFFWLVVLLPGFLSTLFLTRPSCESEAVAEPSTKSSVSAVAVEAMDFRSILWSAKLHELDQIQISLKKISYAGKTSFFIWNSPAMIQWLTTQQSERAVQDVFLGLKCGADDLVLDIGANIGFYSLLSLSLNCSTYSFEPQRTCHPKLLSAISMDNLMRKTHHEDPTVPRYRLFPNFVGTCKTGVVSDKADCAGRWPQEFLERKQQYPESSLTVVECITLHKVVDINGKQRIKLMKIDTEGAEYYILSSSLEFFERKIVEKLVVETTPIFWQGLTRKEVARIYVQIFDYGYDATILGNGQVLNRQQLNQFIENQSFVQVDILFSLRQDSAEQPSGDTGATAAGLTVGGAPVSGITQEEHVIVGGPAIVVGPGGQVIVLDLNGKPVPGKAEAVEPAVVNQLDNIIAGPLVPHYE